MEQGRIGLLVSRVLAWSQTLSPFVVVVTIFGLQGCGDSPGASEAVGSIQQHVTGPASFTISLPNQMAPQAVPVWGSQAVKLANGVQVRAKAADAYARVVNVGTSLTELGADATAGTVWAGGDVSLSSRVRVQGDLFAAGGVAKQTDVVVTGLTRSNTPLTPLRVSNWQVELPPQSLGDASLEPDRSRTIAPGGYTNAYVKSRSTLALSAGTYVFDNLSLEPQAKLSVNDAAGPVIVYVNQGFTFRGAVLDAGATPDEKIELLVVVRGTNQTTVETAFKGTVFSPNGTLYLGPLNGQVHFGAFFGKEVRVEAGTIINHRAFPWQVLLPPAEVSWTDAPVVLRPSAGTGGGTTPTGVAETTPPAPVNFTIPDTLWVSSGNAGNGVSELTFRTPAGVNVVCQYRGGSPIAHPTTDLDTAKGRRYRFVSCNNGMAAGGSATGTWFKLAIVGRDSNYKETVIEAHLGGGCSGSLPPPMNPEEVVVLRQNFDWLTTGALPETDPDGRPALWHGQIYIEHKRQLEALDRWRVKWSALPFAHRYLDKLSGKCGRMEHASDGKGVFVYAVFPAKLFNILRHFAQEAKLKNDPNYPPPFTVIVPTAPEEAEYANVDGSLKYSALASSGYLEWLQQQAAQLPWFGEDLVDDLTEPFIGAADWVDDNIIDPVEDVVEDGIAYVGSIWDNVVDWVANAIDDVWEYVQEGLGAFVGLASGEIDVSIDLRMMSRDASVPGRMFRMWGTPVPSGSRVGQRPWLMPHGIQARIRQWGWGFLPVLHEAEVPDNDKPFVIQAVEGASGRGDVLCFELESDAGMITTDLIPNEVCGFDGPMWGGFEYPTNNFVVTDQQDLHVMTQIIDSADYVKTVIGHTPENVDVLTGFVANTLTATLNGGPLGAFNDAERAMALCLDFPSLNQTAVSAVFAAVGAAASGGGGALVAYAASPIIMKDIWWPDVGDSTNSRVATHEYGHFLMCDMMYYEEGPSALTPLMGRVLEGQNDSPGDTIAIATEAWADTFSMQVVGASNYVDAHEATDGKMKYCLQGSCMDYNYRGDGDYPDDAQERLRHYTNYYNKTDADKDESERIAKAKNTLKFYDELARTESIIHDLFDRADSANRERNQPWNGDVLHIGPLNKNVYSPTGYLAFDDETVSLSGGAWRNWVTRWVDSGDVSPDGMLRALNGTAAEYSHNWCQRCEAFALHDLDTPGVKRRADLDAAPSAQQHLDRWIACATGKVGYFHDAAPEPRGNISPQCRACPSLNFADPANGGVCTPCPAGEVPRGDHCEACPDGSVPTVANECSDCPPYQISVNGVCQACRFGEGADRATNTCVECTPDAALDWRNVETGQCNPVGTAVSLAGGEAPGDNCPGLTWFEINHLDALTAQQRSLQIKPMPEHYFAGSINQLSCPNYSVRLEAFKLAPLGDPMAWTSAGFSGDGQGSWGPCGPELWCLVGADEPACQWDAGLLFEAAEITAAGNRLRFRPSASSSLAGGPETPVRLFVTGTRRENSDCDPH